MAGRGQQSHDHEEQQLVPCRLRPGPDGLRRQKRGADKALKREGLDRIAALRSQARGDHVAGEAGAARHGEQHAGFQFPIRPQDQERPAETEEQGGHLAARQPLSEQDDGEKGGDNRADEVGADRRCQGNLRNRQKVERHRGHQENGPQEMRAESLTRQGMPPVGCQRQRQNDQAGRGVARPTDEERRLTAAEVLGEPVDHRNGQHGQGHESDPDQRRRTGAHAQLKSAGYHGSAGSGRWLRRGP